MRRLLRGTAIAAVLPVGSCAARYSPLWALLPGTATTGGVGTLWFGAGPRDERDGLVGQLVPVA